MPRDDVSGAAIVDELVPKIDKRPTIEVVNGKIDLLATAAEAALKNSGLPLFQRGASLVVPVSFEVPAGGGRMTLAAGLKEISSPALVDHLAQAAHFERFDARAKKAIPCNPPGLVASIILSRSGRWTLPNIAGVITTPTLRPDGSLLTAPGYDPATRLYYEPDPALRLPVMKAKPTKADAEAALKLLDSLLIDFPFVVDEGENPPPSASRAVALSGMISPNLRGMLPVVPAHAVAASTPGTGKSFYVDIASAIHTGRPCPVLAAGEKEEETEKRLVGALIAAFPIVSIDNCNGELGGDVLCQAIERPLVRVRALGNSDISEIESRATFFATGNGLRVRGDMTRRSLICRLDANVERPELRNFQQDPLQRVLDDRGAFVAAALTIVRAYLAAGQPDRIKPALASFPDWSNTIRSALMWLGCADPVATMEAARDDDPELTTLRQVIGAWHTHYADSPQTGSRVADEALETERDEHNEQHHVPKRPDLREALMQVAGERNTINTRRLGNWLSKHEGRIVQIEAPNGTFSQLRFKKAGTVAGAKLWKVGQ